MLIRIRKPSDCATSEITPKATFLNRRRFIATAAAGAIAPMLAPAAAWARGKALPGVVKGPFSTDEKQTPYDLATTYNNFYEFGTSKGDPAKKSGDFIPKPWSVTVEGEVGKPGTYDFDDLIKPHMLEERIYRMRCVEAWSMVIPWTGIPLADVIKRLEPTSKAKYVAFETLYDKERMPGQGYAVLDWPYVEGLRMDEAMNPLALLAVGLYGEEMPNQNGAPIRLVVPWKYGFKSIKSIVKIRLQETMPPTSWNKAAPREYGFYSNVNPEVNHPRWSQAKERRIDTKTSGISALFLPKQPTLMFNGYADEVAQMYTGMDMTENY
jgi:sulfoxide reductase catalytic subunit YedY